MFKIEVRVRLARIEAQLTALTALVVAVGQKEIQMAKTLDDLILDVTAQSDVVTGVRAVADQIITQELAIKAQLDAAIASGNPAKVQAAADALANNTANLQAAKQAIADAVAANTPAAP